MARVTVRIPAAALRADTAQIKQWDLTPGLALGDEFAAGDAPPFLRRWQFRSDRGPNGGAEFRVGFDADGTTTPITADGQDLPSEWEVLADAITLEQGASSITVRGPAAAGNTQSDSTEFYVWQPPAAEAPALRQFFFTDLDTSADLSLTLRTTADTAPSYGGATIADQRYFVGVAERLVLPAASGGNGAVVYALTPAVPGLSFDTGARTLSGTPTAADSYAMIYTATDEDGDTATLTFAIAVSAESIAMLDYLASLNLPYPETAVRRWGLLRAAARTMQSAADAVVLAMREWWPLTASEDGLATHARQLDVSPQGAGETDDAYRLRVAREPANRRLWGRHGAVTAALDAIEEDYDTWEFPRDGLRLDVDELDGDKRLDEGPALLVWPSSAGSLTAAQAAEMQAYLERTLDADVEVRVSTDLPLA
ncbi:MAG: hypothetical protein OXC31_26535 [Spirochaetaceae bacterium]|nr:hypothetical protein [Spirochaetaceae bacterium]